jgi:hypothetical protein
MAKKICAFLAILLLLPTFLLLPMIALADEDPSFIGPPRPVGSSEETQTPETHPDVKIDPTCMLGICSMNVFSILGIRKNAGMEERTSVLTVIQDIVMGVTMFIGVVVTLAFVASGVMMIVSSATGNSGMRSKATRGMIMAVIGMVLVGGSYAIVMLIQFIARG